MNKHTYRNLLLISILVNLILAILLVHFVLKGKDINNPHSNDLITYVSNPSEIPNCFNLVFSENECFAKVYEGKKIRFLINDREFDFFNHGRKDLQVDGISIGDNFDDISKTLKSKKWTPYFDEEDLDFYQSQIVDSKFEVMAYQKKICGVNCIFTVHSNDKIIEWWELLTYSDEFNRFEQIDLANTFSIPNHIQIKEITKAKPTYHAGYGTYYLYNTITTEDDIHCAAKFAPVSLSFAGSLSNYTDYNVSADYSHIIWTNDDIEKAVKECGYFSEKAEMTFVTDSSWFGTYTDSERGKLAIGVGRYTGDFIVFDPAERVSDMLGELPIDYNTSVSAANWTNSEIESMLKDTVSPFSLRGIYSNPTVWVGQYGEDHPDDFLCEGNIKVDKITGKISIKATSDSREHTYNLNDLPDNILN